MKHGHPQRLLVFLAAVLVIGCATPHSCRAQTALEFEQRYDRFKDYTSLSLELGRVIKGLHHEVVMSFHQTYRGEGRSERVGPARLRFYSDSDDSWVYLEHRPVTLLVDGGRMRFDPDHDGTVGRGYVLEYMWVRPSDMQSQKLLGASEIEGQLGIDEFKLGTDQLAAIKEFALLVETPDRPVPSGHFVAPPPPPKPKSLEETAREQEFQRREAGRLREEARRKEEENRRRQEAQLNDKLEQKLRLGKALERRNAKAALQYFKEVVKLAPDTAQAKSATERMTALSSIK